MLELSGSPTDVITRGCAQRSRARSALQLMMLVGITSLATAALMAIAWFAVFRALATAH